MKRWSDDVAGQITDIRAFRVAIGAQPIPTFPSVSGQYVALTGRPDPLNAGTGTLTVDVWKFAPFILEEDLTVDRIAIETTTAVTTGTGAAIFGLFNRGSDGRPTTRKADWSSYGSIDLTAAAGLLTLTTANLTIPAGEWCVGIGWTGTGTNPVLRSANNISQAVSGASSLAAATGWSYSVSGGSVPSSVTPSSAATNVPIVWVRVA